MEDAHSKSVEEVLSYFGTDPDRGLSPDQVKRNQDKYGPNGELLAIISFKFNPKPVRLCLSSSYLVIVIIFLIVKPDVFMNQIGSKDRIKYI